MSASPNEKVPVGGASAFSNGTNQTFTNTNILNAHGNITYMEWNPQVSSEAFNTFLQSLSRFKETSNPTSATPNPSNLTTTMVNNAQEDGEESSGSSSQEPVNLIPSHDGAFLPDNLSRAPTSRQIYAKTLFPLNYGFPLWFPELDRYHSLERRRSGVSIGDVGIITSGGSFDYLYNTWLLQNPWVFNTSSRPERRTTYQTSFNPGHSTISNLDISSRPLDDNGDILITCKDGDQGAVIAIPDGASEEDLKNEGELLRFICQNARGLYEAAPRSEIDRHSLYLVTGTMKAKTWGISTFEKSVQERDSTLVIGKPKNTTADTSYVWKQTEGATTFRVGPTLDAAGFWSENESAITGDTENQCLFIRGFKISLSSECWSSIRPFSSDLPWWANAHAVPSSIYLEKLRLKNSPKLRSPDKDTAEHPSDALNDLLLSLVPSAKIAITHDKIWNEPMNCNLEQINKVIKERYVIMHYQDTATYSDSLVSLVERTEVNPTESVGNSETPTRLEKRSQSPKDDTEKDIDAKGDRDLPLRKKRRTN